MAAVDFRIPDAEKVSVGHYGRADRWMTAADAIATFMADESREGWEVIIPRGIEATEIHRTRRLRQVFGWRYHPDSRGTRPCPCEFCQRGAYKASRIRNRSG
jgi:hypothetical protein